jgi:hypothetical protein
VNKVNKPSDSIKGEEFLDKLSDVQLLETVLHVIGGGGDAETFWA